MASEPPAAISAAAKEKRHRSIFELPSNFFNSCALLTSSGLSLSSTFEASNSSSAVETLDADQDRSQSSVVSSRLTCNTCRAEFESLQEQRLHFKSDIHRFNEELKKALAIEREKRAAAAARRMAAAAAADPSAQGNSTSQPKTGEAGEINCSCCNVSLSGKVPFHRYNYKYCSTTCMHVHKEFLEEDG